MPQPASKTNSRKGRTRRDTSSDLAASSLRLGLCCQFSEQPIAFRTTTATSLLRLSREDRLRKLSNLCLANAASLLAALQYCAANGIGAFRIGSTILPVKTHSEAGYSIEELPEADRIVETFLQCGRFAAENRLRTSFHPDQYVVLNSPREDVVEKSLQDLEYHAEVARWVGADVINIHGGGAYGDKTSALAAFARNVERLSDDARQRLTLENDDKVYTPADLLPLCRTLGIPLVYDVHHHRCLPDGLTVEAATDAAVSTWNREPMFHISSPLEGWDGPRPERHHDEIMLDDFPSCWRGRRLTVEVEAKAKERAVLRLLRELAEAPAART
ncbi:MAG: UV DNA damage repair endonuclease UvsE [Planctomycetaceae bacterium]|nr:UV DNA damage repair endonuclease UvsE [Planctomycetaceae bacterium]